MWLEIRICYLSNLKFKLNKSENCYCLSGLYRIDPSYLLLKFSSHCVSKTLYKKLFVFVGSRTRTFFAASQCTRLTLFIGRGNLGVINDRFDPSVTVDCVNFLTSTLITKYFNQISKTHFDENLLPEHRNLMFFSSWVGFELTANKKQATTRSKANFILKSDDFLPNVYFQET